MLDEHEDKRIADLEGRVQKIERVVKMEVPMLVRELMRCLKQYVSARSISEMSDRIDAGLDVRSAEAIKNAKAFLDRLARM